MAKQEEITVFTESIPKFLKFLKIDYFPQVTLFKFESSVFQFESPLNFLMLRTDFKEFLEAFYQAESLLSYSLKFYIDSLFTIQLEEDRTDHAMKKHEASQLMLKDFFTQMYRCIEILKDYNHLLQHDVSIVCGRELTLGCFFRKYGASLLSVGLFIIVGVVYFKRQINEVLLKGERKII